jgi:transposase-like protein
MGKVTSIETVVCPICGGHHVEYMGFNDGGGDYGTAIEEWWRCWDCVEEWVEDTFELPD